MDHLTLAAYGVAVLAVAVGWFRPAAGFAVLLLLLAYTRELGAGLILNRLAPFDMALAGLAGVWVWRERRAGGRQSAGRYLPLFVPVLLFVALAVMRAPAVLYPAASLIEAGVYLVLVMAAVLTWAMSEGRAASVYRTLVLAMTLVAVLCGFEWVASQQGWPTLWPETFRILGPFKNPNQTGSFFAMGLPLVLGGMAAPAAVNLSPWLLLVFLCLKSLVLLVTFSRTSMAAGVLGVILFYALLALGRRRGTASPRGTIWRLMLAPLLLVFLVVGVLAAHAELRGLLIWKLTTAYAALTQEGFLSANHGAAQAAWAQHPVMGVGLGTFAFASAPPGESMGNEVHGSFFAIPAETGLAGVLLMAAFLITLARRLWTALRTEPGPLSPLLAGAMAGLGALTATGVWDTFLRKRHFWVLAGLALALAAAHVARRGVRSGRTYHPPTGGMRVRSEPDLERALQEIERAGLPVSNPYLSPAWLRAWYRHLGSDLTVDFLLVYRDGELVGYGPFGYTTRWGHRLYRFLGHGTANYLEPVARPGAEEDVAAAVAAWFRSLRCATAVAFHDLNSDSPVAAALKAHLAASGARADRYRLYDCPHMELGPDWEAVLRAHTSHKRRYNLRRADRQLSAMGKAEFRVWSGTADVPELLAYLPELRAVHRARFQGVINDTLRDSFWAFLADVIPGLLGRGLEIATLTVEGRLISFAVCLFMGDRCVLYVTAMDPAFRALGPGHLLLVRLFQWAIQRGFRIFDFSKGAGDYKELWQDGVTFNEAVIWWVRPGLLSSLLRLLQRGAIAGRLWARRHGVTLWLRTLPQRLQAALAVPPRCTVRLLPPDAAVPAVLCSPVLLRIRSLPLNVQEAIVQVMVSDPGAWRITVEQEGQRVYLVRKGTAPRCVSWGRES